MNVSLNGKKAVVCDVPGRFATQNMLFDEVVVKEHWYRYSGVYLYERCLEAGFQLLTPDLFYDLKPKKAVIMRDNTTAPHTSELVAAGAIPAVLVASEYPLYTPQFFYHLEQESKGFGYAYVPSGARGRLAEGVTYRRWYTPHVYWTRIKEVESNFAHKKFLTLINSNSRVHPLKSWYARAMNLVKPFPSLVTRELYLARLDAIQHFSTSPDFDLYGHGWDKPVRYTGGKYDVAAKRAWRGEVDDKFATLQGYKFSICFENCIFDGWVTEKIMDSLYAGCVPVYWGPSDMDDFVPRGTYIDYRDFKNFTELEYHLRNMDERTYSGYIDRINAFITSRAAYNLSQEKYASDMIEIFSQYFA